MVPSYHFVVPDLHKVLCKDFKQDYKVYFLGVKYTKFVAVVYYSATVLNRALF